MKISKKRLHSKTVSEGTVLTKKPLKKDDIITAIKESVGKVLFSNRRSR